MADADFALPGWQQYENDLPERTPRSRQRFPMGIMVMVFCHITREVRGCLFSLRCQGKQPVPCGCQRVSFRCCRWLNMPYGYFDCSVWQCDARRRADHLFLVHDRVESDRFHTLPPEKVFASRRDDVRCGCLSTSLG